MSKVDRHTDSLLIVYPQERFAAQAIERFEFNGLSFETIEPPAHLRDVACPAVKVSRSLFGRIHEASKEDGLFHIGIVDWRPLAPNAGRLERAAMEDGPLLLETVQITFIAPCMAFAARLSRGETDLTGCPHMYLPEDEPMRKALLILFPGLEAGEG